MDKKTDWGEFIFKLGVGYLLVEALSKVNTQAPLSLPLARTRQPLYPQPANHVSNPSGIAQNNDVIRRFAAVLGGQAPPLGRQTQPSISDPQAGLEELVQPIDTKWLEVIVHPSVELILGGRGSGKTALGYRQLELFRWRLAPYVLGVPKQAQSLLPDWIGIADDLEGIPRNSIVLVDEAYILYHSRGSMKAGREEMSQIVNLSRQRNQTFIFVTQEARQIDKNIASAANVITLKEPGMLQPKFDRPEFNEVIAKANKAFERLSGEKRRYSYVYSPDAKFMGLLENSLPTFWKPSLSRIFAGGDGASGKRVAKRMTKDEIISRAKELRQSGLSYREIGNALGVNESTAYNYVKGYPYQNRPSLPNSGV